MTAVLLFGGQGSQTTGMLHDWSTLPQVAAHVAEASEVLGEDVLHLDTAEALTGTRAVQLSLLILQCGIAAALEDAGLRPDIGAGHSLGGWSAAVAAGALGFADAVRLVDIRATGMAKAAPDGYGMSAVMGLREPAMEQLVAGLREEGHDAWLTNANTPTQFTVSGSEVALDLVNDRAADAGATKVVRLAVAVPAHSPLMEPARDALAVAARDMTVGTLRYPVLANTNGRLLRRADRVLADLVGSTSLPVQWTTGMSTLAERGVDCWIQTGPGRTLLGMLQGLSCRDRNWTVDGIGVEEAVTRWRVLG